MQTKQERYIMPIAPPSPTADADPRSKLSIPVWPLIEYKQLSSVTISAFKRFVNAESNVPLSIQILINIISLDYKLKLNLILMALAHLHINCFVFVVG